MFNNIFFIINKKRISHPQNLTILGDSISDPVNHFWTDYIPTSKYNIKNHAHNGHTIINHMDGQVVLSENDNADKIIIFLGTNDSGSCNSNNYQLWKNEIEENILELQTTNPNSTIYYINVLPKWEENDGLVEKDTYWVRFSISEICEEMSITCIDTYNNNWILPSDTYDGTHPNESGSLKIWNGIRDNCGLVN